VTVLSEAKIASLQEKIKEARRAARKLRISCFVFFMVAVIEFIIYFFYPDFLEESGIDPIVSLIFGIALAILLVFLSVAERGANLTKERLMRELDSMNVKVSVCPKCGKRIPLYYTFCPFCGTDLTRQ
jgi:hypothetical protein